MTVKGECRQTMIQDGRFLQSEFTFGQGDQGDGPRKTERFELPDSGRSPAAGAHGSCDDSTRMSFRQSEDEFNGEEIVLHSRSLDPDAKETRHSRTVTRLEDDGRKIVHRQYTAGADGKERLVMDLVLTHKADAPGPDK